MSSREKINKMSWTMFEGVKDAISTNIVSAVHGGQLKIEASQVEKLVMLMQASADEGYHRGHRQFMKVVDAVLKEESTAAPDAKKK